MMIKNTNDTFKFAKLNETFLNAVFMAGSNGKMKVDYFKKKVICIKKGQDDNMLFLRNDFEIYDIFNEFVDPEFTGIFQNGMVKVLPAEETKEYIDAFAKFEQEKLDARVAELRKLSEQE